MVFIFTLSVFYFFLQRPSKSAACCQFRLLGERLDHGQCGGIRLCHGHQCEGGENHSACTATKTDPEITPTRLRSTVYRRTINYLCIYESFIKAEETWAMFAFEMYFFSKK